MKKYFHLFNVICMIILLLTKPAFASGSCCSESRCCGAHGISYCDTTAGHYVCNDGGYSACICTEQAVITGYEQFMTGCCVWHGGVISSDLGEVICADGTLSAVCSLQYLPASSP